MATRPLLPFLAPLTISKPLRIRAFTTSTQSQSQSQSQPAPPITTNTKQPSSRWLSLTKARLGKCIMFGLTPTQTASAASLLSILGKNWRTLVAGSEGFVTPGLLRHKVVWGEMDSMGHVNNVMYVRYAESARMEWASAFAKEAGGREAELWREMWTPRGEGMILRSMRTDYKFPMTYPDHISVFHKLSALPTPDSTSFILDVAIFSEGHQRPAARCVEDIVVYDYRIGKPIPIRPFMMKAFEKTWEEQESVKRESLEAIEGIEVKLRELEVGSWDREGAVEDMGTAP